MMIMSTENGPTKKKVANAKLFNKHFRTNLEIRKSIRYIIGFWIRSRSLINHHDDDEDLHEIFLFDFPCPPPKKYRCNGDRIN